MPKKKPRLDPQRPRFARSYGRVSKVGERGKGAGRELWSPAVQIDSGEAYFTRLGIPFDRPGSVDNGDWDESAFDRPWKDRPGICRHLADAKAGRITDLSFYLLSRLGRDLAESLDLIAAFEDAGCLLHFPNEGITPNTLGGLDSGAKLLRNIRLALAETESEDKRLWAKAAARKRAEAGKPVGEPPQWIKKTDAGFTLIPAITATIQEAVRLRLSGLSYAAICRALNDEGHRTTEGKYWRTTTVRKYLTGSFIDTLLGDGFYNRELPEGDPDRLVLTACYPAIITPAEAALLRAIEERTKIAGNRAASTSYLLSGKVRCGSCGSAMAGVCGGNRDRNGLRAYRCVLCCVSPERDDVQKSVSVDILDDAAGRCIIYVLTNHWPAPLRKKPTRSAPAKDALKELKDRRRRLLQLRLQEVVSAEDYNAEFEDLKKKIESLEKVERSAETSAVFEAARNLSPVGLTTKEYLRSRILLLVDRVEAPLILPIERLGERNNGRVYSKEKAQEFRPCARITLIAPPYPDGPTVFVAPLYRMRWAGLRNLYIEQGEGEWERLKPLPLPLGRMALGRMTPVPRVADRVLDRVVPTPTGRLSPDTTGGTHPDGTRRVTG